MPIPPSSRICRARAPAPVRSSRTRKVGWLGVVLKVGRLLVIEHQNDSDPRGDSVMLIYDAGVVGADAQLRVPQAELKGFGFFAGDELAQRLSPKLARRISHALDARRDGIVIELENGVRRG